MEGAGGSDRLKGFGRKKVGGGGGRGRGGGQICSALISCILYVIYALMHICPIGQRYHKNHSGILREFQILVQN